MTHLIKYVFQTKQDLNLSVFDMITGINESNILAIDISCKYKCRFDGKKCNSDQWWNNNKCWCECKIPHVCEKDYIWSPATCSCENGKYLVIRNNSEITCDEIIEEETKTVTANFNEKKKSVRQKIYIFYLPFY